MVDRDSEISDLKKRLAELERGDRLQGKPRAKDKLPPVFIAVVVVVIGAWLFIEVINQTSDVATVPAPIPPAVQLAARVTPGPLKPAEQRAAESLLWQAYPRSNAKARDVHTFYYDGKPVMCGEVGTVRVGTERRFLIKNGSVLLEGDVTRENFDMFWQICTAGGA